MQQLALFTLASIAEILGCFAFWKVIRDGASPWWLAGGCITLILFACLLTQIDSPVAGRTFAAYGGIYISMALLWLWIIEGLRPDRWDALGAAFCLVGAAIILFGPR